MDYDFNEFVFVFYDFYLMDGMIMFCWFIVLDFSMVLFVILVWFFSRGFYSEMFFFS